MNTTPQAWQPIDLMPHVLSHHEAMQRLREFLPTIRASAPTHKEVLNMYRSLRCSSNLFFRCYFSSIPEAPE